MATTRVRRRFLAGATALVLTFAACSGDDDGGADGGTSPDTAADGEADGEVKDLPPCPLGAIEEAGSKPVKITFWHGLVRENEVAIQRLTDEFNSSQDEVEVELIPQANYAENMTKYKAGLGGGDLPDLIQIEDTGLQLMIDSQGILPAQSCIDAEGYDLSDHVERVVEYYSVDDVLYPMPFNVSNPILYYDKTAFTEAGLDPEQPPATLEEVREASQAIVDSGVADFGIAIKDSSWFVEQWMAKAGAPLVNNGNGRRERATEVAFDGDVGKEIFAWLHDMVADDLALDTGIAPIDHLLALAERNAAMTVDSSASLGTTLAVLASGEYGETDLGIAPMPGPEGEGGVMVGGAANYIVNRSSPEEQEAAWRFAKFLNEPDNMAEFAAATGYVPIRKSSVDLQVTVDRWTTEPGFEVAYDQLLEGVENEATAGPVIGAYQEVRDAIVAAMQQMFTQDRPAEEAVTGAAEEANRAIRDYNSRVGA